LTLAERLGFGVALAAALTFVATPYAISLARRTGFFDKPVGYKGHATPTPYLGGLAVMSGFIACALAFAGDLSRTAPLVGGAALLFAVGTIDDRRTVSPGVRVLLELALALLIWQTGLGWHLHAGGVLDATLTCLWVLAVVNAFNLFDNMDGAATTMALVVAAGASMIGVVRGDGWLAVAAGCLCGSCLGFLPRNLSRTGARIFLGDGGSMPVGFAASVVVMEAAGTSTAAWRSLLVALLLIAIPALDMTLVIVSRRRRGVSVLTGGRDHLTHRTRKLLGNTRAVVLSLGVAQAALSVIAALASRGDSSLLVISASLYVLVAGAVIVVLDTQEIEESEGASPGRLSLSKRAVAALAVLGLGAGVSPFFFTYYDASNWVPIGLGVAIVCSIGLVMRPRRPGAPAALSLFGLLGLGVLSLSSSAWAESVENAVVSGNRWLAYGALLLLLLVLVSHDRRSAVLLGAVSLGIGAVAISVLARLLGGHPGSLFLNGRLNSPLGYINGEGCAFAMGVWPCIAIAETRRGVQAGAGLAMATLMACLALLSQSRGTALALALALIAVFALVPGRARRGYAALLLAAGVAAAAPSLLHVYEHRVLGQIRSGDAHAAGVAALLAALGVGAAWALASSAWDSLGTRRTGVQARARALGSRLLLVPLIVVLALAIASFHRIESEAQRQYHAFVHLSEPGENSTTSATVARSRLLSGAGNRYDYWRIAWRMFEANPLVGVGAGNYPRYYFQQRVTTEDVTQPHSIEMQVLSELGLAGLALLCAFVGGVAWGAVRMRRSASRSPLRRALTVAAAGTFTVWFAQTSVDWMHLLPGLTAIALASAAALLWPRDRRAPIARGARSTYEGEERRRPRGRLVTALSGRGAAALGISGIVVTLIVAGASLSREGLADIYRTRAQNELAGNPAKALADANRSLDIDADSLQAYFVKAAALARFDEAAASEVALQRALEREPRNFLTWALLGDVSVRELRFALAARYYTRAHELNPRNATLALLAREPRTAAR
jgi:UDP-GlcNAc:undecaprenyl-phosphate/decaprenyl-phosphate GlcNAc-1-phosphate transferase